MTDSRILDKNLRYKKTLFEQLKVFKEDDSYLDIYEPYDFRYSDYLVRIFNFVPPEELKPKSNIIIPSNLDPGAMTSSLYIHSEIRMPIAKIIKIGDQVREEDRYEVGDLIMLPTKKVMGWTDNPAYLDLMEMSKSNMMPINVTEIEPKIQNIDLYYKTYQFTRMGNIFSDDQDKLTFLLPASEAKGRYRL